MLPKRDLFLQRMAQVYDAMKAARRKTAIVVYDDVAQATDNLPALPLGSTFAMKITIDRVHIERLKKEREADRLKP